MFIICEKNVRFKPDDYLKKKKKNLIDQFLKYDDPKFDKF